MRITARPSARATLTAGALIALAAAVLNAYLLDGFWGSVLSAVGAAPTEFSSGYSDQAFRRVKKGMTTEEVRQILGAPWFVVLTYPDGTDLAFDGFRENPYVDGIGWNDTRRTKADARSELGDPRSEGWSYSRSPTTSPYAVRLVRFEHGHVSGVVHAVYGWPD